MRQLLKICCRMIPPGKSTSSAQRNASIPAARVIEKSSIVWNFPHRSVQEPGINLAKIAVYRRELCLVAKAFYGILSFYQNAARILRRPAVCGQNIAKYARSAVVPAPIFPLSFSAEVWYTKYISPARRRPVYGVDFSHSKYNRGSARP